MSGAGGSSTGCPDCGASASGNFCSECGTPLVSPDSCSGCGTKLKKGALYCANCGRAVGTPPRKGAGSRMPWILSALALAAFSVVIALLVQGQSLTRTEGMTMTGGIPGQPGGAAAPQGTSSMPTAEELANMSPREAADRLFERAMREHGGPDSERGTLFVNMALQAYDIVPREQVDADLHFHVGLLRLVQGDSAGVRSSVESILGPDEEHLLGLVLAARLADFRGDGDRAVEYRARVRSAVEAAGGIPDRTEYQSHRPLIEAVLTEVGEEGS